MKICSPAFFERLVVDLLVAMGYGGSRKDAGRAVGRSGDGGIDGIIKEDRLGLDAVPIRDLGVRRPADLHVLLSRLKTNVARGTPSYVHCWGGIGRTGTVIGCWLVEHDAMDGKAALKRIAELRRGTPDGARRSPETNEQSALVLGWAEIRRSMGVEEPEGG